MIVGITGMTGAGKGMAGDVLKKMRFKTYDIGDVVREMMREAGIPITFETDKQFTVSMRKKYGKLVMIKSLLKRIKINKESKVAIIGIRSIAELEYIKSRVGRVLLIALVAPQRLRFRRVKERGRHGVPKTMQEFIARDKREEKVGIIGVMNAADYVIANTGTQADLRKGIQKIIKLDR